MSRLGVVDSKHDIVLDTIVESGFGAFLGRRVGDYTMRPKLGDHPKEDSLFGSSSRWGLLLGFWARTDNEERIYLS